MLASSPLYFLGLAIGTYAASPTITISAGTVIGVSSSVPSATAGVYKYLGVPFALSPPERFSPPQDVQPFKAPFNATKSPPACPQQINLLAFPGSPEIPLNRQNLGLFDQRKALQWVQANIKSFGGDPAKVTIFGQSAGSYAIKQLVAFPPNPLTFRAAILQSPGFEAGNLTNNWEIVANRTGCSGSRSPLACVRSKPIKDIETITQQQALTYRGATDNVTAAQFVTPRFTSGQAAKVPLLIGNDAEEGRVFSYVMGFDNSSSTQADVDAYLNRTFPAQYDLQRRIKLAYPPSVRNDPYLLVASVVTDYNYICRAGALANLTASTGINTWRYLYNASFPNEDTFPRAGVYHTSEIPQVWGTYGLFPGQPTTQQVALSRYMQKTWADFAKNPTQGPGWARVGDASGRWLGVIGANGGTGESTVTPGPVDSICSVYKSAIDATGI